MLYNVGMENTHGFQTKVLIPDVKIQARIQELALQLAKDYEGKGVILIGVMKGCIIFMGDLLRALWRAGLTDCESDFAGVSSYGKGTESTRDPILTKDIETNISGRHVLLVEDIVDTGHTVNFLFNILSERKPSSLKVLSLLSKPSRREIEVPIDYVGFEIENKWVIGYGLDDANRGRGDPNIVEKLEVV